MKLLKQKWSGELYVWTPELAARPDMEEFVREEIQPPVAVADENVPEETQDKPPVKKRGSVKKALAAKAAEFLHDDQIPGV